MSNSDIKNFFMTVLLSIIAIQNKVY